MECHHIIPEAGPETNVAENCIPLCFDCHADMRSYDNSHPRGTKYRETELRAHRDAWYKKVSTGGATSVSTEHFDSDLKTLESLRSTMPWDPDVKWFSQHPFGMRFRGDQISFLKNFQDWAKDPGNEFLDSVLEAACGRLRSATDEFFDTYLANVFISHGEYVNVPREWKDGDPELRSKWEEVTRTLNSQANEVVAAYEDLIRTGRRRLSGGATD